jgi:uncharacterized protein YjbI with pentapeptide repeats
MELGAQHNPEPFVFASTIFYLRLLPGLKYVLLEGANLVFAHLSGANLTGAHLEGAYLQGVSALTAEQIGSAITDATTTLP